MSRAHVLSIGVSAILSAIVLSIVVSSAPPSAQAAWVNGAGTQFQVGGKLIEIFPNTDGPSFACGSLGGTSLALVQGRKLAGVDQVLHPLVLVVSCLDSIAANAARLNFISRTDGTVVKQISTTQVPSNGWAQLVLRPDKGDLLGCGSNGALYSIDFSQDTTNIPDGTATPLTRPSQVTSCTGLAWDAEADMIYVGLAVTVGGVTTNSVVRFKDGTAPLLGNFTSPCAVNGLSISGGVLLLSCKGALTIHRLDKNTGLSLGAHGTLTPTSLTAITPEPGLGGFACDPVTFHKDEDGKDLFTDALWSRRGANGNGVVALEFPAFTCGLPSNSVVLQNAMLFSPLAAGFSAPSGVIPGAVPRAACFDTAGNVKDTDGDGLPDCWETSGSGIDFDGDGTTDLPLCVQVNTNGDGVTLTTECADPNHKDIFVEIDYMQFHKPDPKALSQVQSVNTPKAGGGTVGVQSVREAFAAAPVCNPSETENCAPTGIRLHMQVNEQVTFTPLSGPPTSHVNQVAFTPCTGPATAAVNLAQAVDFDTVKAANFGTADERLDVKTLNAKRLAFRYVLFAHNLVGNPSGGSNGSGCAELGGDDAVITLGSFAGAVTGHTGGVGTTTQQSGTFMHELGHLLGLEHGGHDKVNCKPNYRSVMSYTRQFSGSPIPNRRLDYSRSQDLDLNEASLNELDALGSDPSRGPIPPFFSSVDQIVFGPNAWSLSSAAAPDIDWNRNKTFQANATANINQGATAGCDGAGASIEGHDDWSNLLYRFGAAVDFVGGQPPEEMTSDDELAFYLARDVDGNGVGDGRDCGGLIFPDGTTSFPCTHRIDHKPGTKGIKQQGNLEIVIFSERNGTQVWDAPAQVRTDATLTYSVESVVIPVKVNKFGRGTCSAADRPDPVTGQKDGITDLHCQFPLKDAGLPPGTQFGIVSGFFFDPLTGEDRAFSARQEVTILP